jgi:leucyl-tRNA synthetase
MHTKCPECGKPATRETDTMDTFVDSSWYFFRYCDPSNKEAPYSKKKVDYWGNIDQYIGGIEHAIMHLLYARFWTKVGRDLGLHSHNEPFQKLLTQGMINKAHPYCPECDTFATKAEKDDKTCSRCGTEYVTKSVKMSKSLGNTVDPNKIIEEYGADSARFFILFGASPKSGLEWSEEGVGFAAKFIRNTFTLLAEEPKKTRENETIRDTLMEYYLHKTIKSVTQQMDEISIRAAVNELIQFASEVRKYKKEGVHKRIYDRCRKILTKLLHPITPHMTEEIWEILGNKGYLSLKSWPTPDTSILTKENEFKWNLMANTIDDIKNIKQVLNKESIEQIRIIIAEEWKFDFYQKFLDLLEETRNQQKIMKELMNDEQFREHGKFINQKVNLILKNIGKYPEFSLTPEQEFDFFRDIKPILEDKFDAEVKIALEKKSDKEKASKSLPGRPSILIT